MLVLNMPSPRFGVAPRIMFFLSVLFTACGAHASLAFVATSASRSLFGNDHVDAGWRRRSCHGPHDEFAMFFRRNYRRSHSVPLSRLLCRDEDESNGEKSSIGRRGRGASGKRNAGRESAQHRWTSSGQKGGPAKKRQPMVSSRANTLTPDEVNEMLPVLEEPTGIENLPKTLEGGESLIFAMARSLFAWDGGTAEANKRRRKKKAGGMATGVTVAPAIVTNNNDPTVVAQQQRMGAPQSSSGIPATYPRWRPVGGISGDNANFRRSPPPMSSDGYAGSIRRNSRKRNKPSMWRQALRTYARITELERRHMAAATPANSTTTTTAAAPPVIARRTDHYEGALVACAKLGDWREALQIFNDAEENAKRANENSRRASSSVTVTETMVVSVIRSCVRFSRCKGNKGKSGLGAAAREKRRESLDAARDLILRLEAEHGIPLEAQYVNPLAAAYQSLGFFDDGATLIREHLSDHVGSVGELNVNNLRAKDEGSYSLLVRGAVANGDWVGAVQSLKDMTDSGVYPRGRSLNSWQEAAERKKSRTNSWKKKRDKSWVLGE